MSSWSNCCAAAKFRADESTGGWRNRIHSVAGGLGGVAAVTSRGRCWGWEGSQPDESPLQYCRETLPLTCGLLNHGARRSVAPSPSAVLQRNRFRRSRYGWSEKGRGRTEEVGHGSGAVLYVQLLPLTCGPHGAWAHTSAAVTARAVLHRISVRRGAGGARKTEG